MEVMFSLSQLNDYRHRPSAMFSLYVTEWWFPQLPVFVDYTLQMHCKVNLEKTSVHFWHKGIEIFFSQWVIIYLFITYYLFLYCINSHLQSENHTCSNHSSCSCRACTCPHAPWDCHNNQMHILKGGKNTRKVNKFEGRGVCCKDEDAKDVRLPLTSDSTVTMFTQTFHHSWANIEAGQCKTKTNSEGLHIHAKQGKGKLCRKSRT